MIFTGESLSNGSIICSAKGWPSNLCSKLSNCDTAGLDGSSPYIDPMKAEASSWKSF